MLPRLPLADATIPVPKVDGVLMALTMGRTCTDTFQNALRLIQRPGTPVPGYMVNKAKAQKLGYGRYSYGYGYGYNYYRYYRRNEDTEPSIGSSNGVRPCP